MNFLYVATFLGLLMLMIQLVVRVWVIDEAIAKVTIPVLLAMIILLIKG